MKTALFLALALFPGSARVVAEQSRTPETAHIKWSACLKQKAEWYATSEALRIADNVLLYQRDTGGWYKNIDMAAVLSAAQKAEIEEQKDEQDSTIDNGATYTQLTFLARVYNAQKQDRHKQAFLKGLDYLLKSQYANGGWPQYNPLRKCYKKHITYKDHPMTVML